MNNPPTNIVMMGQQRGICHICDQEKTLVAFDKTSNLPVCREDLLPLVEADAWLSLHGRRCGISAPTPNSTRSL